MLRWGLVAAPLAALGKSRDKVLDHFVTLYGGCILAEPSKSGIGLAVPSSAGEELDEYERRVEDELKKFG